MVEIALPKNSRVQKGIVHKAIPGYDPWKRFLDNVSWIRPLDTTPGNDSWITFPGYDSWIRTLETIPG